MFTQHLTEWLGYPVKAYDPAQVVDYAGTVYRIATDYGSTGFMRSLEKFLAHEDAVQIPALVIGMFADAEMGDDAAETIRYLSEQRHRLPALKGLFFGDITYEECESSWIEQADVTPIFEAFPALEHFVVRGSQGLKLEPFRHLSLRSLTLEGSGVPAHVVQAVCRAVLPELEHLEIYLGGDQYGGDTQLSHLAPLLDTPLFPNLKSLGLRNSMMADEIAEMAAHSKIVGALEEFDLSLGTITDIGAHALQAGSALTHLQRLNLSHHYITEATMDIFDDMPVEVDLSDPRGSEDEEDDDLYRFVAIGE